MANIAQNAVQNFRVVVWNGTNAADVVETALAINPDGQWEAVSLTSSQLTLMGTDPYGYRQLPLAVGDALLFHGAFCTNVISAYEVEHNYRVEP